MRSCFLKGMSFHIYHVLMYACLYYVNVCISWGHADSGVQLYRPSERLQQRRPLRGVCGIRGRSSLERHSQPAVRAARYEAGLPPTHTHINTHTHTCIVGRSYTLLMNTKLFCVHCWPDDISSIECQCLSWFCVLSCFFCALCVPMPQSHL